MYKPTHATVLSKRAVPVVSSPGMFSPGGEVVGTEYQVVCRSDSGKIFGEDLGYPFWSVVNVGDRLFFEGNRVLLEETANN